MVVGLGPSDRVRLEPIQHPRAIVSPPPVPALNRSDRQTCSQHPVTSRDRAPPCSFTSAYASARRRARPLVIPSPRLLLRFSASPSS